VLLCVVVFACEKHEAPYPENIHVVELRPDGVTLEADNSTGATADPSSVFIVNNNFVKNSNR
jgi:hypothetical protein